MSIETDNLEQEVMTLRARCIYLGGVNKQLCVMIKNAADVLDQYAQTLDLLLVELRRTKEIYSKLNDDLS